MTTWQLVITVAVVALTTLATRLVPFLLFPNGRKVPAFVTWLGRQLPQAAMMMLLVYCLKDVDMTTRPFGLPALLGVAVTALMHVWRKQMILSIVCGTGTYMILLRLLG